MAYIYKITNDINNKIYIGKTSRTLGTRFYEHRRDSINPEPNSKIHNAMNKYGAEHFQIVEIENCSVGQLNEREKYWILKYDSYYNGYNNTMGGDGISLPQETIDKIRELWLKGKTIVEISKELKLSHSTVYHRVCKYPDYDKNENKLKAQAWFSKKVCQYDDGGNYIKTFNSLNEAAKEINTSKSYNITSAIKNGIKCKGYYWTFEGEELKISTNKKKVLQYDKNNNLLNVFDGARAAARELGFKDATGIIKNCNGKQKTCQGYIFKYQEK